MDSQYMALSVRCTGRGLPHFGMLFSISSYSPPSPFSPACQPGWML